MTLEHIAQLLDRMAITRGLLHSTNLSRRAITELTGVGYNRVWRAEPLDTGLTTDQLLDLLLKLNEAERYNAESLEVEK